jgi:acyl-CoA synthetase (NDP forming)
MSRWAPERLTELFAPRSVALVGASERSKWASIVFSALARGGYPGRVELVNRRGGEVFGHEAVARIADLTEPVDLAFVMVPGHAVLGALEDAVAAGVRNAVVLSAGFAESGAEGKAAQEALVDLSTGADLAVLGPNTLGFLNTDGAISLHPNSLPASPLRGHVSLVSQSGALNGGMLAYCFSHAIGVSKVISLGNEAVIDAADLIGYLAEDDDTSAIAVFLEGIRRPDEFVDALQLARARAKPVVVLKVGRHEVTARVAAAHTGAFVGDDRVIDAVLRQHAAVRVDSLEELLTTASVLARTGALGGRRLAVAGISGGACDIIADRALDAGLELPPFPDAAVAALRSELPDFGSVNNPLDVTGAAVSDPALFGQVVSILGEVSEADVVLVQHDIPTEQSGAVETFRNVLASAATVPVPTLVFGTLNRDVPAEDDRFDKGFECIQAGGVEQIVAAVGRAAWWSARVAVADRYVGRPVPTLVLDGDRRGVWSESRSRALLASGNVPLVPAVHVLTPDDAVTAARSLGFPVVVKVNGDDLAHKSELGAVTLDLRTDADVRDACHRIIDGLAGVVTDGFLVSPMRPPATELIVGVARTDAWGLVLAVGFGGLLTEVQADTSLRRLPITAADVDDMLGELRNAAVLDGVRGRPAADRTALVEAILAVADTASAAGEHLESLEVNPLAVDGTRIEALDALVSWQTGATTDRT